MLTSGDKRAGTDVSIFEPQATGSPWFWVRWSLTPLRAPPWYEAPGDLMRDWRPNPFTLTMRRRVAALPKIEACPGGKGEQSKIDQGQDKFRYKENEKV